MSRGTLRARTLESAGSRVLLLPSSFWMRSLDQSTCSADCCTTVVREVNLLLTAGVSVKKEEEGYDVTQVVTLFFLYKHTRSSPR